MHGNLEGTSGNAKAYPISGNPPDQIRKFETEGNEKEIPQVILWTGLAL